MLSSFATDANKTDDNSIDKDLSRAHNTIIFGGIIFGGVSVIK